MNDDGLDKLAQALRERLAEEPHHPDAPKWRKDLAAYDAACELGKRVKERGHADSRISDRS